MNDLFRGLFSRRPEKVIRGDYYYGTDADGDQFDEEDRDYWLDSCFRNTWHDKQHEGPVLKEIFDEVRRLFSDVSAPFLEIACGPGMGLAPIILGSNPKLGCLATDACSILIEAWREYIDKDLRDFNIGLAQFSVMDIPLVDGAFENVTSYIGVSSTRAGKEGQIKALKEIHRVLKDGGRFVAIESDGWKDIEAVKKVYATWDPPLWKPYSDEPGETWKEMFIRCGFAIESCDKSYYHKWDRSDNEFGRQAERVGIEIGDITTLYVLRKV